jgi:hypothetical protein
MGLQDKLSVARTASEQAAARAAEQEFLALAHRRAEGAVAAHAAGLTNELHGAAADLGRLFARLEEVSDVQTADRVVMQACLWTFGARGGAVRARNRMSCSPMLACHNRSGTCRASQSYVCIVNAL